MTPTEKAVAAAFGRHLHLHQVEADDDLFALGADSNQAVLVLLELEEQFGVTIPTEVMDTNREVAALAAWIDAHRTSPTGAG